MQGTEARDTSSKTAGATVPEARAIVPETAIGPVTGAIVPEPGADITTALSGWGRCPFIECHVQRPEKISSLVSMVQSPARTTMLARGMGRSYGDAALSATGRTVLMTRLNRMLSFNDKTGVLKCESGVTFDEILQVFLPRGWFPAVTPGTRFVTMGGAAAFDIHGKNHHRDGSFSSFVDGLELLLSSGQIAHCSRQKHADLFWATMSGMGLTGIITELDVVLRPVESAYVKVFSVKAKCLDEALALFDEHEFRYQYSVAWTDCLASGAALGRSILMFGNHAAVSDLPAAQQSQPFRTKMHPILPVPFTPPVSLVNPFTARRFNSVYYSRHPDGQRESIQDYNQFFYPLDMLQDWNRAYGPRGFVQYQCVFPPDVSREALTRLLELCGKKNLGSFLAVLKRFGPQSGLLSFPMPGYTLALDIPMRTGLLPVLEEMDKLVLSYGGRVYLAKDARMSAETFRAMYPGYERWQALKSKIDPENRFSSALSERLRVHTV